MCGVLSHVLPTPSRCKEESEEVAFRGRLRLVSLHNNVARDNLRQGLLLSPPSYGRGSRHREADRYAQGW